MNLDTVKTEVVERYWKYSWRQPEINLRIAAGFAIGINMKKTMEFVMQKLGVKRRLKRCHAEVLDWNLDEAKQLQNFTKAPRKRKLQPDLLDW